jgi:raffinose/stachyose/melibiose transport system permease protein
MEKVYKDKRYIALFVLPGFILYITILFVPIIQSFITSFYQWDGLSQRVFIGFQNYVDLMTDDVFVLALKNNLIILIMSFSINLTIGVFFAYVISRKIKGSGLFRTFYFLPVVISAAVTGLLWKFILDVNIGIFNNIFSALGLQSLANIDLLSDNRTALIMVSLISIWQWLGYFIILLLAGISGIPDEMFESAKLDGAGEFSILCNIVLPMITPVLKICSVFICTGALKTFDIIYTMTGGGPAHATEVIATKLYTDAFQKMQFGYGSAISTIMLNLSIGITMGINRKSLSVSGL